jgi:hypothetical protein
MIFGKKKLFLFFKNNFKRNNHCKFIHHKIYLITFLSYSPCTVRREYISIIFNVKKCALDSTRYFTCQFLFRKSLKSLFFLLPLLGITNVLHFVWPNPLRGTWLSFAVWWQSYKTFLSVIYEFCNKLVFVPGKFFHPSLTLLLSTKKFYNIVL